jgi:DNA-binding transcriptional MerR regulator
MPYKEKEIEKLYYTIGEVAAMFGVNTSHIRFWSNEFDVIRPATNKKGNRLYTRDDIENFRKIYHLVKEKGFTLRGAKTELKDMRQRVMAEESGLSLPPAAEVLVSEPEIPFNELPVALNEPSAPIDREAALPALGSLHNGDYVGRMAIRTSLEKIRTNLVDLRNEVAQLA